VQAARGEQEKAYRDMYREITDINIYTYLCIYMHIYIQNISIYLSISLSLSLSLFLSLSLALSFSLSMVINDHLHGLLRLFRSDGYTDLQAARSEQRRGEHG